MALRAEVYKALLQVADMDRHIYEDFNLILARHPSETEERLMVRVLAFALNASDGLQMGKGISTEDEADLYEKDPTGAVKTWIQVGLPDEKWLKKASARAEQVLLYIYGKNAALWWATHQQALKKIKKLRVYGLDPETTKQVAAQCARNMSLQCQIQDGELWLTHAQGSLSLRPELLWPCE